LPIGHGVHVDALDAALVYEPGPHDKHTDAPAAEYVPSVEHAAHEAVEAPVVPKKEPAGQLVHTDAPVLTMNRPAAHD
jgi:hypothetical protein